MIREIGEDQQSLAAAAAFNRKDIVARRQYPLAARPESRIRSPDLQDAAVVVEQRGRIAVLFRDRDAVIVSGETVGPIVLRPLVPIGLTRRFGACLPFEGLAVAYILLVGGVLRALLSAHSELLTVIDERCALKRDAKGCRGSQLLGRHPGIGGGPRHVVVLDEDQLVLPGRDRRGRL